MAGVVIRRVGCVFPDVLGSFAVLALCVTPVECVGNLCVLLVNRFSLCLTDLGYFLSCGMRVRRTALSPEQALQGKVVLSFSGAHKRV